MAKKTPTWLVGCGVGCGVVILVMLLLFAWGAVWMRGITTSMDEAVASGDEVEKLLGGSGGFTPPPDGSIPAARMEAFLAVREATQASRAGFTEVFAQLPLSEGEARAFEEKPVIEKLQAAWKIGGSALGMARVLGTLIDSRNKALLAQGMSLGEYTYIYCMAYYAFLGHSPGDGPEALGGERKPGERSATIKVGGTSVSQRLREEMLSIMRNQLAAIPAGAPADLRAAVQSEVEALERDEGRIPWADGLPEPLRASMDPYRERLESSYSPATNEFELGRARKTGRFSFTAD